METKPRCHAERVRKLKIIAIAVSSFLFLFLVTAILILNGRLADPNRSKYKVRNLSYSEIVKKNYIDGFKNTENTGDFTYILPQDDVNELLSQGVESINDKHINAVYFEPKDDHHYFYVDLKKVFFKTRVVIETTAVTDADFVTHFLISDCRIGKTPAFEYLKSRSYMTKTFLDDYFKKCNLPMTYNETYNSFDISPLSFIKDFSETKIGTKFFSLAKEIENSLRPNVSPFGFTLNFSKIVKNNEFIEKTIEIPGNFYNEISSAYDDFDISSMYSGEKKKMYSISQDTLSNLLNYVLPETTEDITSNLTDNVATFKLKGASFILNNVDAPVIKLFYSMNGYLIDVDINTTFVDLSTNFYSFAITWTNSEVDLTNEHLNQIFNNIVTNQPGFFTYSETSQKLSVNLKSLNDSEPDFELRFASKNVQIDPSTNSVNFIVTK